MKNLIITFLSLMVLSSTAVFAEGIEVLPTMQSRTNAQDRVWVGTFQLVWNDFVNKVIHIPVRFREGTPVSVQELNKQTFTETDLSENCYYKKILGKFQTSKMLQTSTEYLPLTSTVTSTAQIT